MLALRPGLTETGRVAIGVARETDMPAMLGLLQTANMHRIPSEEMPELDWRTCFVARSGNRLVGLAGYKILSPAEGKTTLMVVHPDCRGRGTGLLLQAERLRAMARQGVQSVITNADRPETIAWYKKHFGYVEIGRLKKVHEFGDPGIPEWTTLRMDLSAWADTRLGGY